MSSNGMIVRDDARRDARAAGEYEAWKASLRLAGKTDRTIQHYAYTVEDLLDAHPNKAPDEFTR